MQPALPPGTGRESVVAERPEPHQPSGTAPDDEVTRAARDAVRLASAAENAAKDIAVVARDAARATAPRAPRIAAPRRAPRIAARLRVAMRYARSGMLGARDALLRDGPSALQFWLIALLVGIVAGYAAIGFRVAISSIQTVIYGADDPHLHSRIEMLDWMWVLTVPILGGLAVGLILWLFTDDGKAASVSNVIEAAALKGGRGPIRSGLASAAASIITLSTGGSTGREGPVVHLASLIASWVSTRIDASNMTGRDLLGCAVAAAVSASFNAPIAGALFAMEVILRHFALHAFAPIVIASVAGTTISRLHMGDVTEFRLPEHSLAFYQELPAFLLLGIVCGFAAVAMMRAIFFAEAVGDRVQVRTGMPGWLRPAVSGAMLGAIAIWFPHIIGVGYETTSRALTSGIGLHEAIIFAIIKVIAVAITFAGRMGGGVFSPSLMLGALTGLAFGYVSVTIFPSVSGSEALYALAGTGAVAAAVLGAPVSTIMIIFELTGDWQAGIAVMTSVSMATVVSARMVDQSFFLTQLAKRGIRLAVGAQAWLPGTISVRDVMRVRGDDAGASDSACWALVEQGVILTRSDTLQKALPMFDQLKSSMIPVVETDGDGPPELIGAVFHVDALKAFNRALVDTHREEHS
ncbi:MAG: CIC family chloride channel protein [Paracoccaceae bacterium]|jgi:CIC family chloride channel protein